MTPVYARALRITEQVSISATIEALADSLKALHSASEVFVGEAAPRLSLGKPSPEQGSYLLVSGSLAQPIQVIDPQNLGPLAAEEGGFLVQLAERWVDALAQVAHLSGSSRDASSRDALTGVLNRRGFLSAADQRLEQALAEGRSPALLLLDVRDFSEINSRLGYELGDELLFEVASRVRAQLRDQDLLARLECDQFVVLLDQIPNAQGAARVAQRMLSSLEGMPIDLWSGVRLGTAMAPNAGTSVLELIEAASEDLNEVSVSSPLQLRRA